MSKIIDFTECKLSPRNLEYGGRAGEKKGIVYDGSFWILKFPKNTNTMDNTRGLSYVTSPLSEYIGSNIFRILGMETHETLLGICHDGKRYKTVCACKDFIEDEKNELLIPYTALRNDTNPVVMSKRDSSSFSASNINEIIFQLENNTILSNIGNARKRFWDTVIIDMLINNNDRNEDNWGVIKYRDSDSYRLAPVYDCGNCFYGKTSEDRIREIMSDNERLKSSALNGITAYEDDDEKRIKNINILETDDNVLRNEIPVISGAVAEKINDIERFIRDIPSKYRETEIMSDLRKDYYIQTLMLRYTEILRKKAELLKSGL